MDLLQNLALGFSVALTLKNIAYCFAGTLLGTFIGVFIPVLLLSGLNIVGVNQYWQYVITGLVLGGAVYLDQIRRRLRERT